MSELEKILKDVLYGSVGAVATVAEKTAEIARGLVKKGGEVMESSYDKTEELRDKGKQTLSAIGKQISELTDRIRGTLKRGETEPEAATEQLKQEMEELEVLEQELDDVSPAEQQADPAANCEELLEALLSNAAGFADRVSEETGEIAMKVSEAIDNFVNRPAQSAEKADAEAPAEKADADAPAEKADAEAPAEKPAPVDVEALLKGLQQKLSAFGSRLQKALEEQQRAIAREKEAAEARDDEDGNG